MSDTAGTNERLILVSQSPRRAALLRDAGYDIEVCEPAHQEPRGFAPGIRPAQMAEAMSFYKARSVASRFERAVLLGADTVVAIGEEVFGKPADVEDARRILSGLCGTTQQVITGVTLLEANGGHRLIRHDSTDVTMREMSDGELDEYLAGGAWRGKAGAYGIQDRGDAFVTRVEGSFSNVVGLPLELLRTMLIEFRYPALVPERLR